jgi:thioredoxin 1
MAKPVDVTDETFGEVVLESELPTIVDFWAVWCMPCKMIAPVLEDIATEYDGRLQVVKLDVDSNNQTAMEYGVMGIPTLILFKGGQPVEHLVGLMSKARILDRIEPHL